jgi:hypothetical protein
MQDKGLSFNFSFVICLCVVSVLRSFFSLSLCCADVNLFDGGFSPYRLVKINQKTVTTAFTTICNL